MDYNMKYKLRKTKPYVKLLKYTISLSMRDYICLKIKNMQISAYANVP